MSGIQLSKDTINLYNCGCKDYIDISGNKRQQACHKHKFDPYKGIHNAPPKKPLKSLTNVQEGMPAVLPKPRPVRSSPSPPPPVLISTNGSPIEGSSIINSPSNATKEEKEDPPNIERNDTRTMEDRLLAGLYADVPGVGGKPAQKSIGAKIREAREAKDPVLETQAREAEIKVPEATQSLAREAADTDQSSAVTKAMEAEIRALEAGAKQAREAAEVESEGTESLFSESSESTHSVRAESPLTMQLTSPMSVLGLKKGEKAKKAKSGAKQGEDGKVKQKLGWRQRARARKVGGQGPKAEHNSSVDAWGKRNVDSKDSVELDRDYAFDIPANLGRSGDLPSDRRVTAEDNAEPVDHTGEKNEWTGAVKEMRGGGGRTENDQDQRSNAGGNRNSANSNQDSNNNDRGTNGDGNASRRQGRRLLASAASQVKQNMRDTCILM